MQEGFRIVHHAQYSPRKPEGHCYEYSQGGTFYEAQGKTVLDAYLEDFVGDDTLPYLLMFIDSGTVYALKYKKPILKIFSGYREWAELFRRLAFPHYEEARLYWDRAIADGFFAGMNEIVIYLPGTLQEVIRRYGSSR